MLNNVPKAVNYAGRLNTLGHPNSIDCEVFKKVINRTADTEDGNAPTLGGMGVLDSEDEFDYDYEPLGSAKVLFLQQFTTDGSNWQDNDESLTYQSNLLEALIEPIAKPDFDGYFLPDKHDLVTVLMGESTVQTYQIVGVTGSVMIPPFTRRYVLNPREDENIGI